MDPPQKRRRVRRHQLHYKQPIEPDVILTDEEAHTLLLRSIAMTLTAAGFSAAEPDAMESIRDAAEEYIHHMLSLLSETMLTSRRVTAIPQDFASIFAREGISLTDLIPTLRNPTAPPSLCQPALRPPSPDKQHYEDSAFLAPILGPELMNGDSTERERFSFIPRTFPSFPSKHTYRATPDVKQVERDARRVRERAIEEARLAEEALRRLMSAGRGHGGVGGKRKRGGEGRGSRREEMEDVWRQTMDEMAEEGKDISPSLEGRHWMKFKRTKRRHITPPSSEAEMVGDDDVISGSTGGGITTIGASNGESSMKTEIRADATSFQTMRGGIIKDSQSSGDGTGSITNTQSFEEINRKHFQSNWDGAGSSFQTIKGDMTTDLQSSGETVGGEGASTQTVEGDNRTEEIQSSGEGAGDLSRNETGERGSTTSKNTQISGGDLDVRYISPRDGGSSQTVQSSQANHSIVGASSTTNTSQTVEPSQANKEVDAATAAIVKVEDRPSQTLEGIVEAKRHLGEATLV
ncbi:MAG: hypothetical protein M1816_008029 [Peltula sp. TS41687]|nr:MAG: hypothetical protein M1816_008029 [Peltula sp. TS41687]